MIKKRLIVIFRQNESEGYIISPQRLEGEREREDLPAGDTAPVSMLAFLCDPRRYTRLFYTYAHVSDLRKSDVARLAMYVTKANNQKDEVFYLT